MSRKMAKTPAIMVTGLDMDSKTEPVVESLEKIVEKFTWKIKDFVQVQMDRSTVDKQTFSYTAGCSSLSPSNWEIGLRYDVGYRNTGFFLKLKDIKGAKSIMVVKAEVQLLNSDGLTAVTRIDEEKEMKPEKEIFFRNFLSFQQPETSWKSYIDSNKTLTFEITLTIHQRKICAPTPKKTDFHEKFMARVQKNYALLLEDSSTCDIKLVCKDGKEVNAHSVILKAQWPAFPSLLWAQTKLAENDNGIIQVDIPEKAMKILLKYFYTGELEETWTDSDIIHKFIDAVGKYELKEIQEMFDENIGKDDKITYNIPLLVQVKHWKLKNAEKQIVERIAKMSLLAKTSEDLLSIYGKSS